MAQQRLVRRRGIARWLALLAVVLLVAASCGDDDDGDAADDTGTTAPAGETTVAGDDGDGDEVDEDEGPTTVRVTTLFVCSEAHLAWGMEQGIFEDHGIDVELVRTAGGAAGLAAIVSGDADLSSTNPASAILSAQNGFPIQLVAGSFDANPEGEGFSEGVVVPADSDIEGPGDLAGRKVAVNELGSQNDIFTKAWIREAGVNPSDVNMLALPFPQLVPALQDGRVDAALLTGSQVAQMVGPGDGRKIGNPLVDVIGPVPIASYIATEEFLEGNREAVDSFVAALSESIDQIEDPANRDEVLEVASEFCEAPVEGLRNVRFVDWNAFVDVDTLSQISEILVQEGMLREPYPVEDLVADTAVAS